MRLLDLCCGAGGAAMGYSRAGFSEIVGIDIQPQPNYPFEFIQRDALSLDYEFLEQFDLIHASPPCQQYSKASAIHRRRGKVYPDLLSPVRRMLVATGKPYVIENVPGAPMRPDICLCGTMFGLRVLRHRYFETNLSSCISSKVQCNHQGKVIDGHYVTVAGNGGHGCKSLAAWAAAMGIDWMTRDELKEAIPPAFTEFIGRQALLILERGEIRLDAATKQRSIAGLGTPVGVYQLRLL